MNSRQTNSIPDAPIHPLSSLVTVILDWIWTLIELPAIMSLVFLPTIIPLSMALFLLCSVSVSLIQKFVAKDEWGASIAKGLAMGIAAGVPYPLTGTLVGAPLLVWAGVHHAQKLLSTPED